MKPEYLSQPRIKSEFELTDTQIRSLGEPDATRPNPHYRSGPPMTGEAVSKLACGKKGDGLF